MKTEIAVLSGKEPYGVRVELTTTEVEKIADLLNEVPYYKDLAEQLYDINHNVKQLNTDEEIRRQKENQQKKGKANHG